jgi:glycosyltransferase involved in cell wall biosynthesis
VRRDTRLRLLRGVSATAFSSRITTLSRPAQRSSAPLRLAYLHYLTQGDTANHHVRQFTEAAQRLGHRVDVLALRQPVGRSTSDDGGAAHSGAKARRRWLSRYLREPKELLSSFYYHRRELELLRELDPDVMLVRNHPLIASAVWTSRRLGLPLVLEVNAPRAEAMAYDLDHYHVPLLPHWIESLQLRCADTVVTVSSALRDHLVGLHGLHSERFVVAPNGADVSLFRPETAPDPNLADWTESATVIGFVGSFERWHGIDLLAEMTLDVAAARPATRFLYVGTGPQRAVLEERTEELGARVRFTGPIAHQRVPAVVAVFDVAVMPESNFYGSPLKVLEWMAAARAIVAPGYGPLTEIIEPERDGLLFEPRNRDQLVASVLRLVDDEALRRRLGAEAAGRVRSRLTWEDNARRVFTACRLALDRRSR